jgi:hypothetical protein
MRNIGQPKEFIYFKFDFKCLDLQKIVGRKLQYNTRQQLTQILEKPQALKCDHDVESEIRRSNRGTGEKTLSPGLDLTGKN